MTRQSEFHSAPLQCCGRRVAFSRRRIPPGRVVCPHAPDRELSAGRARRLVVRRQRPVRRRLAAMARPRARCHLARIRHRREVPHQRPARSAGARASAEAMPDRAWPRAVSMSPTASLPKGASNPADPFDRNQIRRLERVLCLSEADGALLWKYEYECPYTISYPAGPASRRWSAWARSIRWAPRGICSASTRTTGKSFGRGTSRRTSASKRPCGASPGIRCSMATA
jgi:hypothetical protein